MTWLQVYIPVDSIIVSSLLAAVPLLVLFYALAVKKAKGHVAASLALASAILLAFFAWGMPASLVAAATTYGMAIGIFPIVWIVVTAVWVYRMTVESGQFEIIKDSLAQLTDDRRLQALFIAFAFSAFLEGTAGFGTPVAISAAMLMGLGFNPVFAAGICLIANTAPVTFGAIGIPVTVAAKVTGLDVQILSQYVSRMLPVLSCIVPSWICMTMCGFRRTVEVLPAILTASICFAGTQFLFANFHGPYLPDVMAALVTIIGLVTLLRFWQPAQTWHFQDEPTHAESTRKQHSPIAQIRAWMPYIILAVFVFLWGIDEVKTALNTLLGGSVTWPILHQTVIKSTPIVSTNTPYGASYGLDVLSAGGTAILLAGLLSVLFVPGYSLKKALVCLGTTISQLRWPIVTIALVLGLAQLMNYSGMSSTLGMAFTNTGSFFPFFAPLLGWLGVFLTGSCTSSNALFGSMQQTTAMAVGVDPYLMVAANGTGGVTGKMISPQSISVATAATDMVGQEGALFRFAFKHSIFMTLLICILVYLQAYVLRWMLP